MLKNDRWIREQAALGMIQPFQPQMVRQHQSGEPWSGKPWAGKPCLSYGTGSYGYDLRLSPNDFQVFRHQPGRVTNPKRFSETNSIERAKFQCDADGMFYILPAYSYGLGIAWERLCVPNNIIVICVGKSTYARSGIIVNVTPAEAGWRGHLTLEFSNCSPCDCRLYALEGICQLLFFEGDPCETTYGNRDGGGKYQDQPHKIVLPRV